MIQTSNITANGNTYVGKCNALAQNIFIFGTWNGAAVNIYCSADGTNYVPANRYFVNNSGTLTSALLPFTADECRNLTLNPGVSVMAVVSNAGASTNLAVQIV